MKSRYVLLSIGLIAVALMIGCGTKAPKSFLKTLSPGWASIEIREGLAYEKAWDTTLELLIKNFGIEKMDKDEGYIRTEWLHSWSGEYLAFYRVRVTCKFSPERNKLQFLSEAQYLLDKKKGTWALGSDSRLTSTLKTDLMGTIGRTTR